VFEKWQNCIFPDQGDQIWRIFRLLGDFFAYWAIFIFFQLIENYKRSANSWAVFFHCIGKKLIGLHFGRILTNSSGHPGVTVMITILCDFCQFSAKNWRFSQKPML
jgi:hypothetical protein